MSRRHLQSFARRKTSGCMKAVTSTAFCTLLTHLSLEGSRNPVWNAQKNITHLQPPLADNRTWQNNWDQQKYQVSVVYFYPQGSVTETWGPWTTGVAVAANWASTNHGGGQYWIWQGCCGFKNKEWKLYSNMQTPVILFRCLITL